MKKLLAMMLTLTMLLTAVPAVSLAESTAIDEKEENQLEGLPLYMTLAAAALILDVSLRYARKRREQWQE